MPLLRASPYVLVMKGADIGSGDESGTPRKEDHDLVSSSSDIQNLEIPFEVPKDTQTIEIEIWVRIMNTSQDETVLNDPETGPDMNPS